MNWEMWFHFSLKINKLMASNWLSFRMARLKFKYAWKNDCKSFKILVLTWAPFCEAGWRFLLDIAFFDVCWCIAAKPISGAVWGGSQVHLIHWRWMRPNGTTTLWLTPCNFPSHTYNPPPSIPHCPVFGTLPVSKCQPWGKITDWLTGW